MKEVSQMEQSSASNKTQASSPLPVALYNFSHGLRFLLFSDSKRPLTEYVSLALQLWRYKNL